MKRSIESANLAVPISGSDRPTDTFHTMRVLMVSTYELGRQPVHVASPAGRLVASGHDVRALDLAVEPYDAELVDWADRVAISVPMHTAMRLGVEVARSIRAAYPTTPVAMYGLYAGMGRDRVVGDLIDAVFVGEYEQRLSEWIDDPASHTGITKDLRVDAFTAPCRGILPTLDRYAHLVIDGTHRLVGAVETSHGCRHRCRHCPIPAVYDGIFRIVGMEPLLADVQWLVDAGAEHITFADADFLNGPAHARRVLGAIHDAFPSLTLDVTVKVEHLLQHADLLPELVNAGVIFAVSAFESTDDHTLTLLDKGHSAADLDRVMEMTRRIGLDLHPSWLPFTPWTEIDHILDMFNFLDRWDLFDVTDPVQLAIRLLVPDGSLVLGVKDVQLQGYDDDALSYRWLASDPRVDDLQTQFSRVVAEAADSGPADDLRAPDEVHLTLWRMALEAAGRLEPVGVIQSGERKSGAGRPRMTEPWFC